MREPESIITLENLHWSYGEQEILKEITQEIQNGCFTGILGPNGSGKTTILRLMMRILHPEKNTVFFQSKEIHDYPRKEIARRIGTVPQQTDNSYPFSVYEMVMMGRYPHKGRLESLHHRDHDIVRMSLEKTQVYHLRNHAVHEISGGELQRVVIARALAQEPGILALDEPTSHLDPKHQLSILGLLKDLVRDEGISVICVLHDLNSAMRFSDQVLIINRGKIAYAGPPEEVITPEHIKEVYGVEALVRNLDGSKPHVLLMGI